MTAVAQIRQSLSPEEWRYVGAGALGAVGVVFLSLGVRRRLHAPPLGETFGDPYCDESFYRQVLSIKGSSGRQRLRDEAIHRAWLYAPIIIDAAHHFGVPPDLMMGLTQTESGFNPQAGSSAGARGLMQLMPGTARSMRNLLIEKGDWPFLELQRDDPQQSAWLGTYLISRLLRNRGVENALAAYNAGGGRIKPDTPKSEWPSETRGYVPGVMRRRKYYQEIWALCGSPVAV